MQASDLLESALSNFRAARKGTAALLHSSLQSQVLTDDKVCTSATQAMATDRALFRLAYSIRKLNVSHVFHRWSLYGIAVLLSGVLLRPMTY